MNTEQIHELIETALEREAQTGQFADYLQQQLPRLHQSIQTSGPDAVVSLLEFVTTYLRHVPDFLTSVAITAQHAGVSGYVTPFLNLAEDYFLSPPELLSGEPGLDALLDEAYLAHRLIDEVNDRHIKHAKAMLLPIDMTRSNLIVHAIIGEPLANRLDALVEHTVSRLVEQEHLFESSAFQQYLDTRASTDWSGVWSNIPCMTEQGEVSLALSSVPPA